MSIGYSKTTEKSPLLHIVDSCTLCNSIRLTATGKQASYVDVVEQVGAHRIIDVVFVHGNSPFPSIIHLASFSRDNQTESTSTHGRYRYVYPRTVTHPGINFPTYINFVWCAKWAATKRRYRSHRTTLAIVVNRC